MFCATLKPAMISSAVLFANLLINRLELSDVVVVPVVVVRVTLVVVVVRVVKVPVVVVVVAVRWQTLIDSPSQ